MSAPNAPRHLLASQLASSLLFIHFYIDTTTGTCSPVMSDSRINWRTAGIRLPRPPPRTPSMAWIPWLLS